jgi:hypothetical protein
MGGSQSADDKSAVPIDSVKVEDGGELPSGGYSIVFDSSLPAAASSTNTAAAATKLSPIEEAYQKGKEEGLQTVQQSLSVVAAQVRILT